MTHTVLFVGGAPDETAELKRLLHRESYRILEASSGCQALEMCDEAPVSVIVADERSPGMSGLEILTEISQRQPEAIRILLTSPAGVAAAAQAARVGLIHRFSVNPRLAQELAVNIDRALEHRATVAENQRLSRTIARQAMVLNLLEERHPGITEVHRDTDDAVIIESEDLETREIDPEPEPTPAAPRK
jgi:DNA-binding NtrC family response regulator